MLLFWSIITMETQFFVCISSSPLSLRLFNRRPSLRFSLSTSMKQLPNRNTSRHLMSRLTIVYRPTQPSSPCNIITQRYFRVKPEKVNTTLELEAEHEWWHIQQSPVSIKAILPPSPPVHLSTSPQYSKTKPVNHINPSSQLSNLLYINYDNR